MHSTCSDGELTPTQLVQLAHRRHLEYIAITDHDTASGFDEAVSAALNLSTTVITGVELTAVFEREVHILGFFFDPRNEGLMRQFDKQREIRRQRVHDICAKLKTVGVDLDAHEIINGATGNLGRPHVAHMLMKKKFVATFNEAFQKYLGRHAVGYVEVPRISAEYAINLIHKAGGVAVIAHPGVEKLVGRLSALAEMGLDGVEINHPSHKTSTRAQLIDQAKRLNLLASGGSDLHTRKSPCKLGDLGVTRDELSSLHEAANRRRKQLKMMEYVL